MNATDVFKKEGIFFGEDTINNIPCSIGYIKQFRWSWMATQLNLFIMVGETDQLITLNLIRDFSALCFSYADKNNRGWPRGLQAGTGSIAILKGSNITPEAAMFCKSLSKTHWSGFEIPVLCDTQRKEYIRFLSNPMWGRIYFPFFAQTIDRLIPQL